MMICKLIRFLISGALDSDRDLSGLVKWHIKGCCGCRQFHAASQSLTHRLIMDASEAAPIAGCALRSGFPLRMTPAFAFASILLCLAMGGSLVLNRAGVAEREVRDEWLFAAVDDLSAISEKVLADNPLEQEMAFVAEDTVGALDALIACLGLDSDRLLLAALE